MDWLQRDEPRLAGEQFLHHGLLEGAGLLAPLLQRGQFDVHVRQRLGDGSLFDEGWWHSHLERLKSWKTKRIYSCLHGVLHSPSAEVLGHV